jgi:hypothetical protein
MLFSLIPMIKGPAGPFIFAGEIGAIHRVGPACKPNRQPQRYK